MFIDFSVFFMVSEPTVHSTTLPTTHSTATTASTTPTMASSTNSGTAINITNQPLLLLSNMSNMMTVKLENSNYTVWKHQITMVLETYSMIELLNGSQPCPNQFLKDNSGAVTTNLNLEFHMEV